MRTHIVQKGDTLWKIAKQYSVGFEELKRLNSHLANPDYIVPGMEIYLPEERGAKEQPKEKERQIVPTPPVKETPSQTPPLQWQQPTPVLPEFNFYMPWQVDMTQIQSQQAPPIYGGEQQIPQAIPMPQAMPMPQFQPQPIYPQMMPCTWYCPPMYDLYPMPHPIQPQPYPYPQMPQFQQPLMMEPESTCHDQKERVQKYYEEVQQSKKPCQCSEEAPHPMPTPTQPSYYEPQRLPAPLPCQPFPYQPW